MSRRIEVFTAGCPVCNETISMVKEATRECGCEVIERRCSGEACSPEAVKYGVKALPTIVVDGVKVFEGRPAKEEALVILTRW